MVPEPTESLGSGSVTPKILMRLTDVRVGQRVRWRSRAGVPRMGWVYAVERPTSIVWVDQFSGRDGRSLSGFKAEDIEAVEEEP